MYNFKNDYSEGGHPRILEALIATNLMQQAGYGEDEYSLRAKDILRNKMSNPEAAIHFVSGGTQANLLVITSLLRLHEAVISADTGHIYVHETGAIEAVGHRVITVPTADGKLRAADLAVTLPAYTLRPHVVRPRLVYISNASEIGTIYTKEELRELSEFCHANDLLLFMDGARLGHALTAEDNDMTLADIAALTDVFYIGATKNGGLLGEAIVFTDPNLAPDFDYVSKQKGALLAKGRLLGIQFLELFRDDLYFELARHANRMAMRIADAVHDRGYGFLTKPQSNQIFPILPNSLIQKLSEHYQFYEWKAVDAQHTAIRIITSWATTESAVEGFVQQLKA